MKKKGEIRERRRHVRHRPTEKAYVFMRGADGSEVIGLLGDLSKGGLAMFAPDLEQGMAVRAELDIMLPNNRKSGRISCIYNLPYRLVSETINKETPSFTQLRPRRLGVQFVDLLAEDLDRLEEVLSYYQK